MVPRSLSVRLRASALLLLLLGMASFPYQASAATLAPGNVCFVPNLYLDLLARQPVPDDLVSGLAFLGSQTREDYAATLLASNEYRGDMIQSWFQKYLSRSATDSEVSFYLGLFGTDEQVITSITSSTEYFQQARVGGDNTGFVQAIFQDLLARAPVSEELTPWVDFLDGGGAREVAPQTIMASDEYRTDIVQAWYQRYLHRTATDTEAGSWQSFFQSGGTEEQVIANLTGSDEYFARAGLCSTFMPLLFH